MVADNPSAPVYTSAGKRGDVTVSSGCRDAVMFWELAPPIDQQADKEQQLAMLRSGLRLSFCNDALVQILGFADAASLHGQSAEELLKRIGVVDKLPALVDSGYCLDTFGIKLTDAKGGNRNFMVDAHCVSRKGRLAGIWFSIGNESPLPGPGQEPGHGELEFRSEQQLAAARDVAERANQAKTRFIHGLSHEMRTPLNAILGFSQLLERLPGVSLSQRQSTYLRQIYAGGEHLLELVNDVLDLSRIEAGEIRMVTERVDLGELVEDCLQLLRPQANERAVTIQSEIQFGLRIVADPTRLKQILFNLLSNGVKYNSNPGVLTVAITDSESGRLRVSIADTGGGIPRESLDNIFEPFNRLGISDVSEQGTGLGMTITRELVTAMHGEMGVNSVLGEGTEFWVELPQLPEGDY